MIIIMRSITKQRVNGNNQKQEKKHLQRNLRSAFTILTLLGLTWTFAFLAIGEVKTVFQWLFTFTTSLQGVFIFVLYTVRNPEVTREFSFLLSNNRRQSSSKDFELTEKKKTRTTSGFN